MPCAICEIRRPKRYCPGVRGDICTICCGTEREETIDCPLDCLYLQQAHELQKLSPLGPDALPNADIKISDEFLDGNDALLTFLTRALFEAALETSGAIDYDMRDALDALTRTFRTLLNGIVYESRPQNPIAANVCRIVTERLAEYGRDKKVRDAAILGVLVFLQRIERNWNNGRKKGRAFIDFLRGITGTEEIQTPSLIAL